MVALPLSAVTVGCAVAAMILVAGDNGVAEGGAARAASSILLCAMVNGALIAIALRGALLALLIAAFGHDSPSTTDLDRLRWIAVPSVALVTASAAAVLAARLWARPQGGQASFPIALALVVLAAWVWIGPCS
jgi:hypothetical protein